MQLDPAHGDSSPTYLFMAAEVRTGSTYIAELISYSLNASFGYEVWNLTKESLRDLNDDSKPDDVREEVSSLWLSPQNIRASKVMCAQLSIINRCARIDRNLSELVFGRSAKWIVVRRRNKVRQAVSLAVARQSGVFHSYERHSEADQVKMSIEDVEDALRAVILSDEFLRLFSFRPAVCTELFYEDVLEDPAGSIRRALEEIGLMPSSGTFALADAKLMPDGAVAKAKLESSFGEWLLENYHPTQHRKQASA